MHNGWVEIRKVTHGLPQTGILAKKLLEKSLEEARHYQTLHVTRLWQQKWHPIMLFLVTDDFELKHVGKECVDQLITTLEEYYNATLDYERKSFFWEHA